MTHKQQCIQHCKEFLQQLNLAQYFNESLFMHVYRKQNGAHGNAFSVGIDAADHIIINSKNLNDESGNTTEA